MITPIPKEFHAAREVFGATESAPTTGSRLAAKKSGERIIRILQAGMGNRISDSYEAQIKDFNPDLIIDSGSCGSLREDLSPGVILISSNVVNESGSFLSCSLEIVNDYLPDHSIKSSILEVEKALQNKERRDSLRKLSAADACSMETYRIAEEAYKNSIPWLSFRIITDFSNEQTAGDFKKNIRQSSLLLYREICRILDF